MMISPNFRLRAVRAAVVATLGLHLAAAHSLDLVDAFGQALHQDPAQRAAVAARDAGREKAVQGDSLLLPQVQLQAGVQRANLHTSDQVTGQPSNSGTGTTNQATVQLVQPVINAAARATRQQLHEESTLADTRYDQARQELILRVTDAYLGVLLADETLRVTLAEKAAVSSQRDRAQARFDVGRGQAVDLQDAQARFDDVLSRELAARNEVQLRRARFQELVGSAPDGLAPLSPTFAPLAPEPNDLAEWQAIGLSHASEIRTRRSMLTIAEAEVNKQRLSSRPTLDLVASVGHQGQNGGLPKSVSADNSRTTMVGLQLTVPLYTGGRLDSLSRESTARREQAQDDLEAARRDTRLAVEEAFLATGHGVARIHSLEQSLRSARTALESTTAGRDVGNRTEVDVLDAQTRSFSVERDLVVARVQYVLDRVRLSAAAGELRDSDVQAVNSWLVSH
jgi:outer membrane protein